MRCFVYLWIALLVTLPVPSLWGQEPGSGRRLLFFTKSSGYEHAVVRRRGDSLAYAERIMAELAAGQGIEIEITKDGTVFDEDLSRFDAFLFYTSGDLTQVGTDGAPPMSIAGKKNLLDAIAGGKGFIGCHCAADTFHPIQLGDRKIRDPYIEMLGGEFVNHGRQQAAMMRIVDSSFPGLRGLAGFAMHEEWYSIKNFARDLHVLLVNETRGMDGPEYDRPAYPATWIRNHGEGRVFYTSMGHREDVWANPRFQTILMGGIRWTMGDFSADTTPNLFDAAPGGLDHF